MHVVKTASLPAAGSSWVPGQACSPSLRWSSVLPTAAPALLSASTCSASGLASSDTPSTSTLSSWRSLGSAATSCCGRPGCAWQAGLLCTCRCRHLSQCLKQEKDIGCRAGSSSHAISWATEEADQQTTIMYAKLQVRAWLAQDNSWQQLARVGSETLSFTGTASCRLVPSPTWGGQHWPRQQHSSIRSCAETHPGPC